MICHLQLLLILRKELLFIYTSINFLCYISFYEISTEYGK